MDAHFYDKSPWGVTAQTECLRPAKPMSLTGFPVLVWAEDALALAHCISTGLNDMHLLVPDECLQAATTALENSLPYKRTDVLLGSWIECRVLDPEMTTNCYPNSIALLHIEHGDTREIPRITVLHPQSHFHFDGRYTERTMALCPPLPDSFAAIRFPTCAAFLDTLIAVLLDPPIGCGHFNFVRECWRYINYFLVCTTHLEDHRDPLDETALHPPIRAIINSASKENWTYLDNFVRLVNRPFEKSVRIR